MPGIVVIGTQWGDEGKGKIIDVFSSNAEYVVRFQGGANAGHTLVVDGKKIILHLVPSGILHAHTSCVISAGVVLDIQGLLEEIRGLKKAGYLSNNEQLLVSDQATLLLSYHKALDGMREKDASNIKIGTTGRGIGPAYEERSARRALLFGDLFDAATLKEKLTRSLREKNFLLENLYGGTAITVDSIYEELVAAAEELAPYRCRDTSLVVHKALRANKRVLFEGAQGSLLDLWHGTYPYVTSSSTLAGAACVGTGLGPTSVQKVIGICKAYSTRVGEGPFPTELKEETGEKLRQLGHEFGSTTGRPRRTGWIDLVALKYAIRLNGVTNLALMKMDVLTGFERIGVCTAYKLNGEIITEYPPALRDLEKVEPIYEYLPGWNQDLSKVIALKDFPRTTMNYIDILGNHLSVPIDVISVGPGREQTLWVKPLFTT